MNKTELLAQLEGRLGSRSAAASALDSVLGEIQRAVAAGERVTLTGFGTFDRVERPARAGRNPRTGEVIQIAASAAPRFHPGTGLRAAVAATTPGSVLGTSPASSATKTRVSATAGAKTTKASAAKSTAKKAPKATAKVAKKTKDAKPEKPSKKSGSGKAAKSSSGKKKK